MEKAKERKANRKQDSKGIKTKRSGAHKVLKQISNVEREKIAMIEHLKWKKTLLSAMISKERDHMNTLEGKIQEFSSLVEEKGEKIKSMMADRKGSLSQKFDIKYHIAKSKLRRKKLSDGLKELWLQREKSSNQMQKYNGKINNILQLLSEYKAPEKTATLATPAPKLSLIEVPSFYSIGVFSANRKKKKSSNNYERNTQQEIGEICPSTNQSVQINSHQKCTKAHSNQEDEDTYSNTTFQSDTFSFEEEFDLMSKREFNSVQSINEEGLERYEHSY